MHALQISYRMLGDCDLFRLKHILPFFFFLGRVFKYLRWDLRQGQLRIRNEHLGEGEGGGGPGN